jgi:hypothetical protein
LILNILDGVKNVVVFMDICQENTSLGIGIKMRIDRRDLKKVLTQTQQIKAIHLTNNI